MFCWNRFRIFSLLGAIAVFGSLQVAAAQETGALSADQVPRGAVLRPAKIAAGDFHGLILAEDGTVWSWGWNLYGQLGDGTMAARYAPIQVSGLAGAVAVAGGAYHSLAMKTDGTVWAWGLNEYGQLGDGTTISRTTPVQVVGLAGILAVTAGNNHNLAVKSDGTVWAWGRNGKGQLGDGTTTNRLAPTQVSGLTGVVAVAAAGEHSLAMKTDGTVWAWGSNEYGQLGDGTTTQRLTPVQVSGLTGIVAVAAGIRHSLALKSDGTAWGCGSNYDGELGDGTRTPRLTPVQVSGLRGVTAVAAGNNHSLAVKSDGTVWAWGDNFAGQVGDGTKTQRLTPVQVSGLTGIVGIAGGLLYSLALKTDGTAWAWGYDSTGQLGDGTTTTQMTPAQVSGLSGVVKTAAGGEHSLALRTDGTVWTWGRNAQGALGDGTTTDRQTPAQVSGLTGVLSVAAGEYHSLALKTDGTVRVWGWNEFGQLGDGTTVNQTTPVPVSGLTNMVAMAGGRRHSLALKSDGTVWAWGDNTSGQMGDGTTTIRLTPVQVSGLTGVVAVDAGSMHSLALKVDGTVWAWGDNSNGQMGDGTTTIRLTPVQTSGLTGVVAMAVGGIHSLAVKSDGTVWAWGNNSYGQIGDGTTTNRLTPVQVSSLTGVVAVAAGMYHSLALKSDGTVWAWGSNERGQLGDGTTTARSIPVQAGGIAGALAVAAGKVRGHGLALKSDGTVSAWGDDYYGQLGDGTSGTKPTPVSVVPAGSPDITISKTHAGNLSVSLPASYTLTLTNLGKTGTSGTITVTDTLPPGLAYAGASGTNWSCAATGRIVTCTNPGPIEPGASSTITLNVDVAPAASPGVTNIATVSNPSDLNVSNNTTGDPLYVSGTGCSYAVTPLSTGLPVSGGSVSFAIQTDPSCSWTVLGLPAWITVSGSNTGTGPGNITLIVAANTGVARTANANIAGIAVAISQAAGVCNYSINPAGQGFPVAGGTGGVDITTSPGCNWSASTPVGWVTLTSTATGSGSGRVTYQVAANTGAARSAALTIAGRNFRVDQSAASIPGLSTAGTLAQVASAGYWTTTFTLVNTGAAAAQVRISFYDDNGAALVLPLTFPQNELGGPLLASTLDRTLNAGASLLIATTGPDNAVVQQGWAQVASDGTVAVSAVLRLKAGTVDQEAVVPLETRSAAGYLLAFDNTNDYSTGIALANTVAQAAVFNVTIKDDTGATLLSTTQDVPTMGHKSFDLAVRFPAAAQKRGTVEFRGVMPGQVTVLGLRFNPKGSFTTIPPAAR